MTTRPDFVRDVADLKQRCAALIGRDKGTDPCTRVIAPSLASSRRALFAVIRLTPRSATISFSDGIR